MTDRRALAFSLAVAGAVLCGAGIATQSRINGQLGAELGDGYLAAVISFGSGFVILCVVLLFVKRGRIGLRTVRDAIRGGSIPWWYACGGAAGALLVLSQGLTSAILGVALFSIGVVCGQTVSGIVVDRIGIGTMQSRPVTFQRVFGAILALAAVALAGASQLTGSTPLWVYLLPFISGLGISWQQAVNGQIRERSESVLTATFINFVVGTAVLVAAAVIHTSIAGWPTSMPSNPVLYLGGAIGCIFIALGAQLVGITGVLLLSLGTIFGQLFMSLVLDLFLPVSGHVVSWNTIVGLALALVAVLIVALSARKAPPKRVS